MQVSKKGKVKASNREDFLILSSTELWDHLPGDVVELFLLGATREHSDKQAGA